MKTDNARKESLAKTDRSLPIALLRAREKVMLPLRRMLQEAELTEQQWRVLRVLHEQSPLEANQVAKQACLFMSSMTRIAQTLVAKGYLTRAPSKLDRRRLHFDITAQGRAVIDDNTPHSRAATERLRECFGAEKMDRLLDLLKELDELEY